MASRLILDHLSLSWANDQLLAITKYDQAWSPEVTNVTLQRSILSEVLTVSSDGASDQHAQDRINAPINDIDVHDNLFTNNDHRNPNGITSGLKVVNNVIYNWHQGAGQGRRKVHHRLDRQLLQGRSRPWRTPDRVWEITSQTDATRRGSLGLRARQRRPAQHDPSAGLDAQWSGSNRVVACYYNCPGYGDQTAGQPLPGLCATVSVARQRPDPDQDPAGHGIPIAQVLGDVGRMPA